MYYVKDLKTDKIHEFKRCIDVTLFVEMPYRLQTSAFESKLRVKERYLLSMDLDFEKKRRINPEEIIDIWIEENEDVRHEKTSLKEISERYNIPLNYVQMGNNKGRLLNKQIKIYTMLKKPKPDLNKNGDFIKRTPAKCSTRVLTKEEIKNRLKALSL